MHRGIEPAEFSHRSALRLFGSRELCLPKGIPGLQLVSFDVLLRNMEIRGAQMLGVDLKFDYILLRWLNEINKLTEY